MHDGMVWGMDDGMVGGLMKIHDGMVWGRDDGMVRGIDDDMV